MIIWVLILLRLWYKRQARRLWLLGLYVIDGYIFDSNEAPFWQEARWTQVVPVYSAWNQDKIGSPVSVINGRGGGGGP